MRQPQVVSPHSQKIVAETGCLTNGSNHLQYISFIQHLQKECKISKWQVCETASIPMGNRGVNYLSQIACKQVRLVIFCELFSRWITKKFPHVITQDMFEN